MAVTKPGPDEAIPVAIPWHRTPENRAKLLGVVMFSPAILFIAVLIGVPFIMAFVYAFTDVKVGSIESHWVGLENFRSILQSPSFRKALMNSFIFTIISQVLVIIGSTILSTALKEKFRGRGFVRFLILLPWVAPISLGAIGWKWILDSLYSVINWVLVALHFYKPYSAPMWLGEPYLAMASVILVHSWRLLPFSTVIMLAGLTSISHGHSRRRASGWRRFLAHPVPDHHSDDAAHHHGGGAVRHHLHLYRHDRRVCADRRRAATIPPRCCRRWPSSPAYSPATSPRARPSSLFLVADHAWR